MRRLAKDFREFIEMMNARGVRYLVIGGYAVAYHAYPRMTGDMDFLLDCSGDNAERILAVLKDFGFGSLDITADDLTTPGRVIQLGYPPNRIDLLTAVEGVTFADAWEDRVVDDLAGVRANIIGLDALKASKAAAGRHKDLADLERLP